MKQFLRKHKLLLTAAGGTAAVLAAAKAVPLIRQYIYRKQHDSIDITVPDAAHDDTDADIAHVETDTDIAYDKHVTDAVHDTADTDIAAAETAQNICSADTADTVPKTTLKTADIPAVEFRGFRFRPAGYLYDEDKNNPENFVTMLGEGLFSPAGRVRDYSASAFCHTFNENRADIYLCTDKNKYYIPGISDMYEFNGAFKDYAEAPEPVVQNTGVYSSSTSGIKDQVLHGDPYPPFIYQGHIFKPAGYLYTRDRYQPGKLVKKLGEGLFGRKGRADDYSIWDFYSRYGNGKATVFLCKENHKHYIPCISDMQEFTGKIRIMGK